MRLYLIKIIPLTFLNPLMIYLHKEWFVTKHIKTMKIIGCPEEIEIIDGEKYLKNDKSKKLLSGRGRCLNRKKIQLILKKL